MAEILSANAALAIVGNCPFPLLIFSRYGRVTGFNRALAELLGSAQASRLAGLESHALGDHPARALLTSEDQVCWTDTSNVHRHFAIHRILLTDQDQSEARFFVDITSQAELAHSRDLLERKLEEQSLTDAITGLLNSRGMMLALEPQVARSRRYNSAISVIMLAVHGVVDREQLLVATARLLKDQLRWADLIACNEQQEFVLALPETAAESALVLADKLRQQVQELATAVDPARRTWICYGVAAWHKSDNAASLLKRAATALTHSRCSQERDHQLLALRSR